MNERTCASCRHWLNLGALAADLGLATGFRHGRCDYIRTYADVLTNGVKPGEDGVYSKDEILATYAYPIMIVGTPVGSVHTLPEEYCSRWEAKDEA